MYFGQINIKNGQLFLFYLKHKKLILGKLNRIKKINYNLSQIWSNQSNLNVKICKLNSYNFVFYLVFKKN